MGGITRALIPAAFGAAGGVALDFAYNFVSPYVPASVASIPYAPQLIKLAGAFGLGLLARKFLGPEKGNAVMAGALTITVYNAIAPMLGGTAGMAGFGAYMSSGGVALPSSGVINRSGMGSPNPAVYLQKPMGRMGRMGRTGAYMKPLAGLSGLPFGGLGGMGGAMMDESFGDGM